MQAHLLIEEEALLYPFQIWAFGGVEGILSFLGIELPVTSNFTDKAI
jgi:hypothetical protein